MGLVDELVVQYDRAVSLPWRDNLSGAERQWMLIYPPEHERRIRFRLPDFEGTTKRSGHQWALVDLTDEFGRWLGAEEYREEYFRDPEALSITIDRFADHVVAKLKEHLETTDEATVLAVIGVASLYPFVRVSEILSRVGPLVPGMLLVFFPGEKDGNTYRLLNARDGWNYLATPITASGE